MLTKHKLKVTKPRLAVLAVFEKSPSPVSAQEIAEQLKSGTADPVTIYRVLETFIEKGVIRQVNLRHNHVDYELSEDNDHHHIICLTCGLVEDFQGCGADALAKNVLKQSTNFTTVKEHAIELFGECKKCAA